MSHPIVACIFCTHLRTAGPPPSCAAYPEGIPDEIAFGQDGHLRKRKGDHGLQFEARDDVGAAIVRDAFGGTR